MEVPSDGGAQPLGRASDQNGLPLDRRARAVRALSTIHREAAGRIGCWIMDEWVDGWEGASSVCV